MTIYESVYEGDNAAEGDKEMQVDGEEQSLSIRFRELPYSVETGEAEMIAVDSVARSARNAAGIEPPSTGAGSQQEGKKEDVQDDDVTLLSNEEEECKVTSCFAGHGLDC